MDRLNYDHLLYFWTVAREGTIARACKKLFLAQPTISGQIRSLERSLGTKLFERVGRNLALTPSGRSVYRYADEIFSLGRDLCNELKGLPTGHNARLEIGVADVLPRWIVYRLLQPVLHMAKSVQIICHDDKTERLMSRLVLNELDVVLSDVPVGPLIKVRAHNHLLGECGVSFMASPSIAARYRRGFPESLDRAPFVLPMDGTALRRSFEVWCEQQGIRPVVQCEVTDSDLFEVFAYAGAGITVVPWVVERRVRKQFQLQIIARVGEIRERYYAISMERKIRHPGVAAIANSARQNVFRNTHPSGSKIRKR